MPCKGNNCKQMKLNWALGSESWRTHMGEIVGLYIFNLLEMKFFGTDVKSKIKTSLVVGIMFSSALGVTHKSSIVQVHGNGHLTSTQINASQYQLQIMYS